MEGTLIYHSETFLVIKGAFMHLKRLHLLCSWMCETSYRDSGSEVSTSWQEFCCAERVFSPSRRSPAAPCSATAHACAGTGRWTSDLRWQPHTSTPFIKKFRAVFCANRWTLSPVSFPNSLSSCALPKEKEHGAGEIRAVIMWTGMFSGWNYSGHLEFSKQPQTFFKLIFLVVKQQTRTLIKALI